MCAVDIKPLKIGGISLKNNLLLAPMAGFTDIAFRRLIKDFGAGLTTTEMASVKGLIYSSEKTKSLLMLANNESPSCVQLFGAEPDDFLKAAGLECIKSFDIIDINMGCPMPKVTKTGAGSALLDDPYRAAKIVEACVKAGKRPVTVKVRLGVKDAKNVVDFCRTLEAAGAAAVTVHGRTVTELYGGKADREKIVGVATALDIPVILNGDVLSFNEAADCMKNYAAAGIMIGRGALYNPWIFSLDKLPPQKTVCEITKVIKKHLEYGLLYFNEDYAVKAMRKFYALYFKGLAGTKPLRSALVKAETAGEVLSLLKYD